ncbi:enoyl-CoA hydratase/isomerase family protein [Desertibaculum subflavum]|uniref:enoyl-CoA hydratase/isomerase family protein n=1 Tax=Desertibaculum subflavum TaxID=2268458 RepID=UPI000E674293
MEQPSVIARRDGRVGLIQLNEPKSMNALSGGIKAGLDQHIPAMLRDAEVRCLVITGEGKAFCAGGDIRSMGQGQRAPLAVRERVARGHDWTRMLLEHEKPVVAMVNGAVAGAGLSLMLMADIVIASDAATFRAGFPALGAVPDLGLAYTLPRAVGFLRAKEMLLTNRQVLPPEAAAMGLVNRVVPAQELQAEAMKLAAQLADGPWSLGLTKTLMKRAYDDTLESFLEGEAMAQAMAFASEDFAEGVEAFMGKRKAAFKGR